ncbi:MAG TPA: hypothetical protein P5084_05910 [Paludibacter sp.]|nr:hypothetical protein [Paludibacter sp.]
MKNEIIHENYFSTKLTKIVNKSFKLKKLYEGSFIIDKNESMRLVEDSFDKQKETESYIINTFNYHLKNIETPKYEDKVSLDVFIYCISFSILNAIMNGDSHSKFLFRKVIENLCYILNKEYINTLTLSDYNKSITYFEKFFVSKPTNGIVNIESLIMEPELLELHKKVYVKALTLTFKNPGEIKNFKLNFVQNVVKFYESEIFKIKQDEVKAHNLINNSNNNNIVIYEEYDDTESYEYDNTTDSPYYNDNLDMDQQSPEFWDSI